MNSDIDEFLVAALYGLQHNKVSLKDMLIYSKDYTVDRNKDSALMPIIIELSRVILNHIDNIDLDMENHCDGSLYYLLINPAIIYYYLSLNNNRSRFSRMSSVAMLYDTIIKPNNNTVRKMHNFEFINSHLENKYTGMPLTYRFITYFSAYFIGNYFLHGLLTTTEVLHLSNKDITYYKLYSDSVSFAYMSYRSRFYDRSNCEYDHNISQLEKGKFTNIHGYGVKLKNNPLKIIYFNGKYIFQKDSLKDLKSVYGNIGDVFYERDASKVTIRELRNAERY